MTNEDIIRMAREAGFEHIAEADYWHPLFERFANLVAAHERNRTWTQNHWTEYERSIVATEREAIENVIEQIKNDWEKDGDRMKVYASEYLLTVIRSRGQG